MSISKLFSLDLWKNKPITIDVKQNDAGRNININLKANGEEVFKGKLLSEPWKDYGVHGAEDIYFIHHKVDDHSVLLYSPGFNEIFGEKKEW